MEGVVLVYTSVLANGGGGGWGRTKVRCKNVVKVIVKLIRKGVCFKCTDGRLSLK
jgi:hypothetical protein